jgi:hypothetical protein
MLCVKINDVLFRWWLSFLDFVYVKDETCLLCLVMAYIWFRLMSFNSCTLEQVPGKNMDLHEARWEIMKSLLEGFPSLKKKAIEYLQDQ